MPSFAAAAEPDGVDLVAVAIEVPEHAKRPRRVGVATLASVVAGLWPLAIAGALLLGAGYALSPLWKVNTRIENIFDRKYEEVAGYGTSGLAAYAGVSAELGCPSMPTSS